MRFLLQHRQLIILGAVWAAVQIVFFFSKGVTFGEDSFRDLANAAALLERGELDAYTLSYISYLLLHTALSALWLPAEAIVVVQLFFSAIALFAFYHAIANQFDRRVAFTTGLLILLWPDLQQWNFYVLSESLFISFLMLSYWVLGRVRSYKGMLLALPIWVITCTFRPNGFIVVLALLAVTAARFWYVRNKMIDYAFVLMVAIPFLILADRYIDTFRVVENYQNGYVIYGYEEFRIASESPVTPGDGLASFRKYVSLNPGSFVKLALVKLVLFFAHVKPYYSLIHNAFICVVLLPVYYFALSGFFHAGWTREQLTFLICIILSQAIVVMLTIEDWDGRLLNQISPFIFLLSAVGVTRSKIFPNVNRLFGKSLDRE